MPLLFAVLVALVQGLTSPPASAESGRAFVQELVTLTADDGAGVPAILTYPSGGIDTHSPAMIYHHGAGGSPVQALGAPRFIAEPLAARGFTGLGILSRHSNRHRNIPFEASALDVKAAADWLSQTGMSEIVLIGHSLGSVRNARYWTDTRDPRIKAMIHFAPTRDMPDWARDGLGDERYAEVVNRLSRMVVEGRGDEYVFDTFETPPPAPPGIERGLPHTAATWLNWWGPAADTRNSELFAKLEMPLLLVAGEADIYVSNDYLASLKAAAVNSPRVDTIFYSGGVDHIFMSDRDRADQGAKDWHEGIGIGAHRGSDEQSGGLAVQSGEGETLSGRDRAAQDAFDWLEDIGLGPRPRVSTQVVDSFSADGVEQSGILYRPAGGGRRSQVAFVLLHDYAGNAMSDSGQWLSVRLAQAGHVALAPRSRAAGAASFSALFADVSQDIAGWVDYLEGRGFDRVILIGEGWGGIGATFYKVATGDSRVMGIAYIDPTPDAPDWARQGLGSETYKRLIAEAQGMVAAGNGERRMIFARGELPPPAPAGITHDWHQTASSFLSEWGPGAQTVHTSQIRKLRIPVLALARSGNNHVDLSDLQEFAEAAGGEADYAWYERGALNATGELEDRVSEDILEWSQAHFVDGKRN